MKLLHSKYVVPLHFQISRYGDVYNNTSEMNSQNLWKLADILQIIAKLLNSIMLLLRSRYFVGKVVHLN